MDGARLVRLILLTTLLASAPRGLAQEAAPPQGLQGPTAMNAPPMVSNTTYQQAQAAYNQLYSNYGQYYADLFWSMANQGRPVNDAYFTVDAFATLRKVSESHAGTYWGLIQQGYQWETARNFSYHKYYSDVIQTELGYPYVRIFQNYANTSYDPQSSYYVYQRVFAYASGWKSGYSYGAALRRHVMAGGSASDATGQGIMNAWHQEYAYFRSIIGTWTTQPLGAFQQGSYDGFNRGYTEGGTTVPPPSPGDLGRWGRSAGDCEGRSDEPSFDDLKCTDAAPAEGWERGGLYQ